MTATALEHNKAIVSRWVEKVFNERDASQIARLKVASYLDWTPFPGQRMDLPVSGLHESLPTFLGSLPDFSFDVAGMFAEDDFVVCHGNWSGTHREPFMGIPATGRRVGGTRIDIFRVVGDKMVEHWGCGNELGFLQLLAVGAEPSDPASGPGAESAAAAPEEVARQYLEEVVNARSVAAVERLVDPSAVDERNQFFPMLCVLRAFPDYRLVVESLDRAGDVVTIRSRYAGTHAATFLGVEATGRVVEGSREDRFEVAGGRIVRTRQDWRCEEILARLGDQRVESAPPR